MIGEWLTDSQRRAHNSSSQGGHMEKSTVQEVRQAGSHCHQYIVSPVVRERTLVAEHTIFYQNHNISKKSNTCKYQFLKENKIFQ